MMVSYHLPTNIALFWRIFHPEKKQQNTTYLSLCRFWMLAVSRKFNKPPPGFSEAPVGHWVDALTRFGRLAWMIQNTPGCRYPKNPILPLKFVAENFEDPNHTTAKYRFFHPSIGGSLGILRVSKITGYSQTSCGP